MIDGGDSPPTRAGPGWYPDPMTPARRRYWTGGSWTYATSDAVPVDHPPPLDVFTLPEGHRLPDPVGPQPAPAGAPAGGAKPPQKPIKWVLAVVVGLLVGTIGVVLSTRSPSERTEAPPEAAIDIAPGPTTSAPPPTGAPRENNDPSTAALASLVVTPDDVPASASVIVLAGGIGLGQPTLDLCNGMYPSESRRAARIQDAALDADGRLVLSTEAVLYRDSGGTTQAFAELRSVVAACPPTPVLGAVTTFHGPPDASWPQTLSVSRQAYDLTTDDGAGRRSRTVAVYLRRGRALLGVYFPQPDGPQLAVEGQTTIQGIVEVFAKRLAALPTSVVGA